GEREVTARAIQHRPWKRERLRASERRKLVDLGATWESQTKQLRDLVVGLARGIVARAAEPAIVADAAHTDQLAVAARDHQRHRPAIQPVILRRDQVRAQALAILEHRGRGVVARGLDAQHQVRSVHESSTGVSAASSHARYLGAPAATRTAMHSGTW